MTITKSEPTRNTKTALEALSMDLKRVALGYHRGSLAMAKRFTEEALKRKGEVDQNRVKPYIKNYLSNLEQMLDAADTLKASENALLLSTLFGNYARTVSI
jgi:hypothetical protein